MLEPASDCVQSPVSGQIQMRNTMECGCVREINEVRLKKKGRIEREVPQVCEVIECIDDDVESTEAVTSPMEDEVDQTRAAAEEHCNSARGDGHADVKVEDSL